MISNRDSDPIEISAQELEDMPLEAAFHLNKENEPLPQHSSWRRCEQELQSLDGLAPFEGIVGGD